MKMSKMSDKDVMMQVDKMPAQDKAMLFDKMSDADKSMATKMAGHDITAPLRPSWFVCRAAQRMRRRDRDDKRIRYAFWGQS
jgi:hypothetical protein